MDGKTFDIWSDIGCRCLELARTLLLGENEINVETIDKIERLVAIAVSIDTLNLRWEEQSRGLFSLRTSPDHLSLQP